MIDFSFSLLLVPVLVAAFVAAASPGPATMAVAREAMVHWRQAGVLLALGITTGSLIWSALAASGMSALILTHAWTLDVLRLVAALYLGWLVWKSGKSSLATDKDIVHVSRPPSGRSYVRGLMIHLTNPKAILFFGALYSVGLPPGTLPLAVFFIAAAVGVQSGFIFVMLALLFSHGKVVTGFARMRQVFEAVFATVFGVASVGFLIALLRRAPT